MIKTKHTHLHNAWCASGCVVECRICNREVAGMNLGCGYFAPKVYSAFHPSWVGKWVPAIAGKAKAGMAHSNWGWTCGCAGKTVKSLENTCHTWALLQWRFTMKRHYIKWMHPPLVYASIWLLYINPRFYDGTKQYYVLAAHSMDVLTQEDSQQCTASIYTEAVCHLEVLLRSSIIFDHKRLLVVPWTG